MADIAMCVNKECPKRFICYRYMAPNNPYAQTIQGFEFLNNPFYCKGFYPLDNNIIRVTEDWWNGKVQDLTPDKAIAKIAGLTGEEEVIRLNFQKIRVWTIPKKLESVTIKKIQLNFFLMKACKTQKGNLVLKPNRSPIKPEFYIITSKILITNPSQKVTVRIGKENEINQ